MGGYGSGRYGGAPVVENGLVLSLSALRREGLLRPGRSSGGLTWSMAYSGLEVGSISYERWIGEEDGTFRLIYSRTGAGEKSRSDYVIRLEATPQPFGGRRWWFVCPVTGARCAKLYLIGGATRFASRRAYHRIAYRSQRATPFDRACERAWNLRRKLGAYQGGLGDEIEKPKWMRQRTFERKLARVRDAEMQANALLYWHFRRLAPGDPLCEML